MSHTVKEKLVQAMRTPMYVFDIGVLKSRIDFLRAYLPEKIELCYAVKANTFVVKEISQWVDWLELCSPGEYQICTSLKIPEEKYVVSGVYKDPATIEWVIGNQPTAGYYTVESVGQFFLLRNTAKRYGKVIHLLFRLTSGNQFGLDKEQFMKLISFYCEDRYVKICGLQFFSGTQKASMKKIRRELSYLDQVLDEVRENYGVVMEKLEYGPGFPVAYFEGEEFEEQQYLEEFSKCLSELNFKGTIALELGRSIAASCGTYWTRVVDTKCNCKEQYAIVDGGMHQIVYYGQMMAMKHPKVEVFPKRKQTDCKEWNICGSLCTINDILMKKHSLPALKRGDLLMFQNAGAYCATEGAALFLSRDIPKVLLFHEDGSYTVVREFMETNVLNTPIY